MKYLLIIFFPIVLHAQFGNPLRKPFLWNKTISTTIKKLDIVPDTNRINAILSDDTLSNLSAIKIPVNVSFEDFTLVKLLANGDKIYQYKICAKNALGLVICIDNFKLDSDARLWMYDVNFNNYIGAYSNVNNTADSKFVSSIVERDEIIIEYLEPKDKESFFSISSIYYFFRGINSKNDFKNSERCMVNAECDEGIDFIAERDATCRITILGPDYGSFCTGTLINNALDDESPYILTANHCSMNSAKNDFKNWEFEFFYRNNGCNSTDIEKEKITYKGCTYIASSGEDYGYYSSDFLLLKLNQSLLKGKGHVLLGWDAQESIPKSGVCFHHPMGDEMKVSTFNTTPLIGSFSNLSDSTHFETVWVRTQNGYSVTQGGSSGSGLINEKGLLVGTLTGGASSCSRPYKADFFGRMSRHWDAYNANISQLNLRSWLDPKSKGSKQVNTKKMDLSSNSISSIDKEADVYINLHIENECLYIHCEKIEPKFLNIYNNLGIKINQIDFKNSEIINISNFSKGLYILELVSDCKTIVKKFVL